MSDFLDEIRKKAENGKKWCYDCIHYRTSYFCGYDSSYCDKFGSLDMDQNVRHPDTTADICPKYFQKPGIRWFEEKSNSKEVATQTLDYRQYENLQGVAKPLSDIKIGDYFKYNDAIWKVVKIITLKNVMATMECDFNPKKREPWEIRTQCIPSEKCLFIDI